MKRRVSSEARTDLVTAALLGMLLVPVGYKLRSAFSLGGWQDSTTMQKNKGLPIRDVENNNPKTPCRVRGRRESEQTAINFPTQVIGGKNASRMQRILHIPLLRKPKIADLVLDPNYENVSSNALAVLPHVDSSTMGPFYPRKDEPRYRLGSGFFPWNGNAESLHNKCMMPPKKPNVYRDPTTNCYIHQGNNMRPQLAPIAYQTSYSKMVNCPDRLHCSSNFLDDRLARIQIPGSKQGGICRGELVRKPNVNQNVVCTAPVINFFAHTPTDSFEVADAKPFWRISPIGRSTWGIVSNSGVKTLNGSEGKRDHSMKDANVQPPILGNINKSSPVIKLPDIRAPHVDEWNPGVVKPCARKPQASVNNILSLKKRSCYMADSSRSLGNFHEAWWPGQKRTSIVVGATDQSRRKGAFSVVQPSNRRYSTLV